MNGRVTASFSARWLKNQNPRSGFCGSSDLKKKNAERLSFEGCGRLSKHGCIVCTVSQRLKEAALAVLVVRNRRRDKVTRELRGCKDLTLIDK